MEVNHEDQASPSAFGADRVLPQGRIGVEGGRRHDGRRPPTPRRRRLKRSVEIFEPRSGELYLLRVGTADDFLLPEPSEGDRVVLRRLSEGYASEGELRDRLSANRVDYDLEASIAQLEKVGLLETEEVLPALNDEQAERYDRQLIYFADLISKGQSAQQLQARLARARVVLIGCGGLGSWTACGLATAGVGSIVLVDDDRVELSNLNRQILFGESDVGELKVDAASRALLAHSSSLEVSPLCKRVAGSAELDPILEGADLLISTADWPPYELPRWINSAAIRTGTPYGTAGQLLPIVRVGPWVIPGETACLTCAEQSWSADYPHYEELARSRALYTPPAATIGAASGVVGSMLAMEAIHFLTGAGTPASANAALVLDLRTMALSREAIRRDPACESCCNS